MSRIRVILADDHTTIRSYIRNVLHQTPDIVVVGEAGDGHSTIKLACDLKPDVVLMDIEMPGLNGVEAIYQLQEKGMMAPILMISSHNDSHLIFALFQIGVAGYICKDEALTQIVPAVRAAAKGQSKLISSSLVSSFAEDVQEDFIEIKEKEAAFSVEAIAWGEESQFEHTAVRVF